MIVNEDEIVAIETVIGTENGIEVRNRIATMDAWLGHEVRNTIRTRQTAARRLRSARKTIANPAWLRASCRTVDRLTHTMTGNANGTEIEIAIANGLVTVNAVTTETETVTVTETATATVTRIVTVIGIGTVSVSVIAIGTGIANGIVNATWTAALVMKNRTTTIVTDEVARRNERDSTVAAYWTGTSRSSRMVMRGRAPLVAVVGVMMRILIAVTPGNQR